MSFSHEAWVLFFALFALYSPLVALPSYLPPPPTRIPPGLLLTAIAVILLANGFTDLVRSALHRLALAPAGAQTESGFRQAQRNAADAQPVPDRAVGHSCEPGNLG